MLKIRMRLAGFLAAFLSVSWPAIAWNATGHRIVAAIAYDRLTPQARARVDELLQHHPDYAAFTRDLLGARAAFIAAAVWPDDIKNDVRFYDDLSANARPTPLLPGFPDMARHTNWHYYNDPYTPDHARTEKAPSPNALTEIERLLKENTTPYDLPWIEHLAGDIHQPLHCINRFLRSETQGDAGGNMVFVTPGRNLHAFWDGLATANTSDVYVTEFAARAVAEHPAPARLDTDPRKWCEESFRIAKTRAYSVGLEPGTSQHPIKLPEAYVENAKRIAVARLALGGYRLAAVLNDKFR